MTLDEFTSQYPPHPPRKPPGHPDENRQLTPADGHLHLTLPPAQTTTPGSPRTSFDTGRHLWAFHAQAIPYIQEAAQQVIAPLASGKAKHSNLTGGSEASSAGELWIDAADDHLLYVNGASGRYGPQTPQELADAVSVFESRQFRVISFGWNDDWGRPASVLR
jgi:hypothetical protein